VQVAVTVASSKKKYKVGELGNFLKDIGETSLVSSQVQRQQQQQQQDIEEGSSSSNDGLASWAAL
jgi:hypothetical protein